MQTTAASVLKKYWGYDTFRQPQEEIIDSVQQGHDTLVLMPTGGGKSLCYQIPALLKEGVCLVVSPLIALMKDQVENLRRRHIKAACIVSGMTAEQQSDVLTNCLYGGLKLLYVAPERLKSRAFLNALKEINISMIAVDEAHCISQWGYDFRPSYLEITDVRKYFPAAPVIALTATATPVVADDICTRLQFRNPKRFVASFFRSNLAYMVFHEADKMGRLLRIIRKVDGCGIVYVPTRRATREIATFLTAHGIGSGYYHAGLTKRERDTAQRQWMEGKTTVIVATNAFGMGIDKPNVRYVVHTYIPATIEAYFQEAGRAGRDGHRSYAVMLYTEADIANLDRNISQSYPSPETVRQVYDTLCRLLAVPLGGGEDEEFPLDIDALCAKLNTKHNTSFSTTIVWSALQILERDGLLYLPSKDDSESTLMAKATRDQLYGFAEANPTCLPVLDSIMRLCGGLFVRDTVVDEPLIAKQTGLDTVLVENILMRMDTLGLVAYKKAAPCQTVILTAPRCRIESLHVGGVDYNIRKQHALQRKEAMLRYVRTTDTCRSIQLLRYFGEATDRQCGLCDPCINRNKAAGQQPVTDTVTEKRIADLLRQQPMTIGQLLSNFDAIDETPIRNLVRQMLDSRLIGIDNQLRLYC